MRGVGGVGAGGEARQSGTPHTLTCLPPLPPLLACLQHTTERSITLAIAKKDPEAGYWPRLLKEAGSRAKNIKVCVWVWGGGGHTLFPPPLSTQSHTRSPTHVSTGGLGSVGG